MDFDLIKNINTKVEEENEKLAEAAVEFDTMIEEARAYAEKHGKPLRDILAEFEPRSDEQMRNLTGGIDKNTTLTPKQAGAAVDPDSAAAGRDDYLKYSRTIKGEFDKEKQHAKPEDVKVNQKIHFIDNKGNKAFYDITKFDPRSGQLMAVKNATLNARIPSAADVMDDQGVIRFNAIDVPMTSNPSRMGVVWTVNQADLARANAQKMVR